MRLKNPALIIEKEDPFKEDALNRKDNILALTQFVSTFQEPIVLCIDSPWGTGKTTFIEMWRKYLINEGFPTLYFNAWENDFSDNALVSLIGEIKKGLNEFDIKGERKKQVNKLFNDTKSFAIEFLKISIPFALKAATSGIIDIKNDSGDTLGELVKNFAEDKIKDYEKAKKIIKRFKEKLSEFAQTIYNEDKTGNRKPLIFFIDEMDRCRPTFSIELLEKAKHLFNVEGVVFVLAIDKEQLEHSIRTVYGIGMNVGGYLRRFIDVNYELPVPPAKGFCEFLFKRFGIKDYVKNNIDRIGSNDILYHLIDTLSELFSIFNFPLRVQEQCLSQVSIALHMFGSNEKVFPEMLAALIALKSANQILYKKFIKKSCEVQDVLNSIKEVHGGRNFLKEDSGIYFEVLLNILQHGKDESTMKAFKRYAEHDNMSQSKTLTDPKLREYRTKGLHKYFEKGVDLSTLLDRLVKKIEISDKFVYTK